jgi:hypothetical protein
MDYESYLRQRAVLQTQRDQIISSRDRDAALTQQLQLERQRVDARINQERIERERRAAEVLALIDAESQARMAETRRISTQVEDTTRQLNGLTLELRESEDRRMGVEASKLERKEQKLISAIAGAAEYVSQCAVDIHPNYAYAVQYAMVECNELVQRVKRKVDICQSVPRSSSVEIHLGTAVACGDQRDFVFPVTSNELSSGIYAIRSRSGSLHFFPSSYPHGKAMVLVQADREEYLGVLGRRFKLESEPLYHFSFTVGVEDKSYTCPLYRIVQI